MFEFRTAARHPELARPVAARDASVAGRPGCWKAIAAFVGLCAASAASVAACPIGDPSVAYCEDFSAANPLATYTVINPPGNDYPFTISIVNQALVLTNTAPGLAFAFVNSGFPLNYRNTLYEADLRFDTSNAYLRSAMAITWANPDLSARMQVAMQLDDKQFNFWAGVGSQVADRRFSWPVQPNRTYRVGFRIYEAPGSTPGRPIVLGFKGYIDGTEIFSETEETLGVNLSAMPAQLSPGFHGGSYPYTPVNQIFDNAVVRTNVRLACTGFEAPLDRGPVTVSKNRALPFKMQLANEQGLPIANLGNVPPVIQVLFTPLTGATVDVTDFAIPVGLATGGNQFVYEDGKWHFNLQTKSYSAPGTYTVKVAPGNGYAVEPTCTASFVVK